MTKMTKDEYLRKFKSRLENISEDANAAHDTIDDFEKYGGNFSKLRDEVETAVFEIARIANDLDRMSMDDVEGEE